MREIKIPVPAVIISAFVGLSLGIAFEYANGGTLFHRELLIFLIPAISAGALLQLIFWLIARRRKVLLPLNLENLTCQIVEFLHLVIKNMRYRKSVRREVIAELAAHFEDQLKDCKTEQEKEQKAKQLIEQFGDPKLLGVLLRRAKKRCRPLWRTAVVRSFQTAGILILCLIVYIVWFVTGKPVITTDYVAEFNRLVRPAADETQNAYPLYDKAIQLLGANSDFNDVKILLRAGKKYEASTDEKGKTDKWITENKEVFDLVIAGSQKPYYWRTYRNRDPNEGMGGVLTPNNSEFRYFALLLTWRARLSAEQGCFEDSFSDLTACYRLGRHIRQGNVYLVEQLIGIAIENMSIRSVRSILDTHKIDSFALKTLQENLERAVANEDFVINFTSEKLFMYDETQRCFTDGAFGSHLYLPRLAAILGMSGSETERVFAVAVAFRILFTQPGKVKTRQMVDHLYDYWGDIAHKTPAQIHSEKIDSEKEFMKIVKGNLLLEMLAPAFERVVELSHQIKTDVQATVAIIALQRYRQDKGQYSDSLNDLIAAGYLKELPIDPYSDKPLIYRKTDAGFTLYSVGLNFKDDGGVPAKSKEGEIILWDNKRESDAVFWPAAK